MLKPIKVGFYFCKAEWWIGMRFRTLGRWHSVVGVVVLRRYMFGIPTFGIFLDFLENE